MNRRTFFQQSSAALVALRAAKPQQQTDTTRFFPPGFKAIKVQTSGATINLVTGGEGPPLLLLHGAPFTHVAWRLVAPELAKRYTIVAPDLSGYGDSSKPPDGENHSNYSKRAMALDQVEVMSISATPRFRASDTIAAGGSGTGWRSIIPIKSRGLRFWTSFQLITCTHT